MLQVEVCRYSTKIETNLIARNITFDNIGALAYGENKIVIFRTIINKSSTQQVVETSCMFLFRLAAFCDTLFQTITILLVSKKKCRTKLQCIEKEKSFSKEFSSFKIRFCYYKVFWKNFYSQFIRTVGNNGLKEIVRFTMLRMVDNINDYCSFRVISWNDIS